MSVVHNRERGNAIISIPTPTRCTQPELLDDPSSVVPELAENLRDIRRLNRWLGDTLLALYHIRRLAGAAPAIDLLDVATGSADIPQAAYQHLLRRGVSMKAVGLEISPEIIAEAQRGAERGAVELVRGDARALPWPDRSFDIVTCCLAIHHFTPEEARDILTEMWRVTRRGVVVVDLVRSYPAYVGTWLATHLLSHNHLTRHDGPLSVLRAYTTGELRELARDAGLHTIKLHHYPLFRQVLTAEKDGGSGR